MTLRLHLARDRPVTPWKNGKGVTSEIAISPPDANIADFDWRVSIADVHDGGPFSNFPGVDRQLAVLDGTILLDISGEPTITLVTGSGPITFPGDIPCRADITDGAAKDLNVMTRRGRFSSHMMVMKVDGPIPIPANACTIMLVALSDLTIQIGEKTITLNPLDALQFDEPIPEEGRLRCDQPESKGLCVVQLFRV